MNRLQPSTAPMRPCPHAVRKPILMVRVPNGRGGPVWTNDRKRFKRHMIHHYPDGGPFVRICWA